MGTPALAAANTAMRLTQSRNSQILHTLGCVEAELGDTAGARTLLYQYVDAAGSLDDSGRLLLGLITEHLGLPEVARQNYEKVAQPQFNEPISSYALEQQRLAAIKAQGHC